MSPGRTFWIGFDMAHAGDYVPDLVATCPALGDLLGGAVYRPLADVARECAALAAQLAARGAAR